MTSRELKNIGYRFLTLCYGKFHPIEKKILFSSFGGKQYSDNPRAICEKMHTLFPDFELVWLFQAGANIEILPDYVVPITISRKNLIKERATAFCLVSNENLGMDLYKRKNQFIVQTWHGDRPLKKVLYEVKRRGDDGFYVADEFITDLCIAGSNIGEEQYRKSFGYKGEVLKVGMPRNDALTSGDSTLFSDVRKKLGIEDRYKILLYAPTFRDVQRNRQEVNVDLERVMKILEQKKENWVCLIRAHSASMGLAVTCDGYKYIDVSGYYDMADLLAISDMLITDYSSCAGDFIITGKATILAAFDKDEYQSTCRKLPFDLKEAGFIVAESQSEIESIISTYSEDEYAENCKGLCDYFGIVETGYSSRMVCERIAAAYDCIF